MRKAREEARPAPRRDARPADQARNSAGARGSALVVALSFAALLALLVTALMTSVMTENNGTDSLVGDTQARYLAESAAEYAIRQLKYYLANHYLSLNGTANSTVMNGFLPGFDTIAPGLPVVRYKAIRIDASPTQLPAKDPDGVTHSQQRYAVSARCYLPNQDRVKQYSEVYINKMLILDMVPLFQYLAFYNAYDGEILPGNNMTLQGRIHTNYDLYIGTESGKTLTIDSYSMRASGTLQRHRKDSTTSVSDYAMTGTVQVTTASSAASVALPGFPTVNATNYPVIEAQGTLKTPSGALVPTSVAPTGFDSNFLGYDGNNDGVISGPTDLPGFGPRLASNWGGSIQTGANSVPTLQAPTDIKAFRSPLAGETPSYAYNSTSQTWQSASGSAATSVKGYYNQNADLVIQSNGTKTQLLNSSGTVLYELTSGTVTTNNLKNSGGAAVTPLSEKSVFDGREYDPSTDTGSQSASPSLDTNNAGVVLTPQTNNGMVKVTQLDLSVLNAAYYQGQPVFPTAAQGGTGTMIYAYRTDTTDRNPNGFRLVNGQTLNNNLSVVSEDPLYIKGDFNTVAGGEKGVVLTADAINLLSNQWDDSMTKSTTALPKPTADLEVNAAIMSGSYATVKPTAANNYTGQYNGGFENFPRFHEDWSGAGKAVNMLGSFNSLFSSTYAKGNWAYGSNSATGALTYTAPVRNWNFDTGFLNKWTNLPGMPISVGETRVVWWLGQQTAWWPLNDAVNNPWP